MPRQRSHTTGRRFLPGESAVRGALLAAGLAGARAHRRRLTGTTFVGITGSAGKTTAKELTVALLGAELRGTWNRGTSNRIAQLAQTVLRTRAADEFCVAEVAAWEPGSVAEIARLIRPHVAVVTRIGLDHHRQFRTVERVAAEKRALVEALPPDGVAVLNADDPHAIAMAASCVGRVVSFGEAEGATLRAADVRATWPEPLAFTLHAAGDALPVRTRLHGAHMATSVLAALGVAHALGLSLERAVARVAMFEPVRGRMSVLRAGGVTFVRDEIKAPAWSFDTVIDFVAAARAARTILVVGTISDYPGSSSGLYRRLARRALAVADRVVFVGPNAHHVARLEPESDGALRHFATVPEAAAHLAAELRDGDLVVLKGSHRADHLARLALARTRTVRCDRTSCRRLRFCDDCRLLGIPQARQASTTSSRLRTPIGFVR